MQQVQSCFCAIRSKLRPPDDRAPLTSLPCHTLPWHPRCLCWDLGVPHTLLITMTMFRRCCVFFIYFFSFFRLSRRQTVDKWPLQVFVTSRKYLFVVFLFLFAPRPEQKTIKLRLERARCLTYAKGFQLNFEPARDWVEWSGVESSPVYANPVSITSRSGSMQRDKDETSEEHPCRTMAIWIAERSRWHCDRRSSQLRSSLNKFWNRFLHAGRNGMHQKISNFQLIC